DLGDMFVATIGYFNVLPGGINTIPCKVEYTIDIRDIDMERRAVGIQRIEQAAAEVAARFHVTSHMACMKKTKSEKMSSRIMETIEAICRRDGYHYSILPSGPFHDTLSMASVCDVGMIFVPSIHGISHSPYEDTAWDDVFAGSQLLLDTVLALTEK
ncbi:MAG: M20/M25/M40 family metallo-hydrolase, partial [Clostridia bacterium]|nr:M20/M25/M40 family metallo-hydrolase [Clostridia bacterium]